jgi:Protein of unknown function (DUF3800)
LKLFFIDETGDDGFAPGATARFSAVALGFAARDWRVLYELARAFKTHIKQQYGVAFNEFKAADLFQHRGPFYIAKIPRAERNLIFTTAVRLLLRPEISLQVLRCDKAHFSSKMTGLDAQALRVALNQQLWSQMMLSLQQACVTATGVDDQLALLTVDQCPGREKFIRKALRAGRDALPLSSGGFVEDPLFRNSIDSEFLQWADIAAYCLRYVDPIDCPLPSAVWQALTQKYLTVWI